MYRALSRLFRQRVDLHAEPRRIVFIRTCCIGDAVMATAALSATRAAFPKAHITWAIGSWSAPAIAHHPSIDAILDTGDAAMPWRSPGDLLRFSRQLRQTRFDMALSLTRSPLMSLALWLSGIPVRVGLDSGGRGFGYNLRVPVDPNAREHEAAIFLRAAAAAAGRDSRHWANLPIDADARAAVETRLKTGKIDKPFIVAHPGGGSNPGASHASKRYPPDRFADMLKRVACERGAALILIGGPGDAGIVSEVQERLNSPATAWIGELNFREIGALAAESLCYIGNDSGLTHLAAASGAATVMLMGPTDPRRYAPFTPDHLALRGNDAFDDETRAAWDWTRHGIDAAEAAARILDYLNRRA